MRVIFVKNGGEVIKWAALLNKQKDTELISGILIIRRLVPRDRIELPTRGFSVQIFENSKRQYLQGVDSITLFQLTFGFVWNCLETFDRDGHNLGTISFILYPPYFHCSTSWSRSPLLVYSTKNIPEKFLSYSKSHCF
jgi:hypothetical protein